MNYSICIVYLIIKYNNHEISVYPADAAYA